MTFNRDDEVIYSPRVKGRKKKAVVLKDEGGPRVLIVTDFGETINALRTKLEKINANQ